MLDSTHRDLVIQRNTHALTRATEAVRELTDTLLKLTEPREDEPCERCECTCGAR